MIIHSLSGPSGTGKSTSALQLAHEKNIEAIIDDGLLIIGGEKIAGTSAKFEKNTLTAVRRAIFQEDDHKKEVKKAIQENNVQSILIIGTSDKMTKQIAQRLELGQIHCFHYIDQIRSTKEIRMAQFVRGTQGKHVMPIPKNQVEQNFFKRFIQKGFDIFSKNKEKLGETTIVRPDFHRQIIEISRHVYLDLVKHVVENNKVIAKIDTINFTMKQNFPIVYVAFYLSNPVNYIVIDEVRRLQKELNDEFIRHFEIEIGEIHIVIKGVI